MHHLPRHDFRSIGAGLHVTVVTGQVAHFAKVQLKGVEALAREALAVGGQALGKLIINGEGQR